MGWDNAQDGVEVERKGTHTAGQGSGGDRTWADGRARDGHARADGWMSGTRTWAAAQKRGWARTWAVARKRGTEAFAPTNTAHLLRLTSYVLPLTSHYLITAALINRTSVRVPSLACRRHR